MKRRASTRPAADRDIDERLVYLSTEADAGVAERFNDALRRELANLVQRPEMGRRIDLGLTRLDGLRCWPVSGFDKVLIFYLQTDYGIEVVRVFHGAQDVLRILREED